MLSDGAVRFLDWLVDRVQMVGLEGLFKKFYGTYPGIVEDVEDPDGRGRCRIRILALGQKRAPRTVWARPIAFGGANGAGLFVAPAVNDPVWVQFEAGDPARPLFLGGFMAQGKAPPEFGKSDRRGLKTPAGHWIRFSDETGDLHITMSAANGAYMTMDKDGTVIASSKDGSYVRLSKQDGTTMHDANGSLIHMQNGAASIITSDGSLEMKDGKVTVLGSSCAIQVSGKVVINAGAIDFGPNATDGVVLGESFSALFQAHTHLGNLGAPTGPPIVPMVKGVHYSTSVKAKR